MKTENIALTSGSFAENFPQEVIEQCAATRGAICDVMVDLETADTSPTAAILSIGAVAFDLQMLTLGPRFHLTIDLQSAVDTGGTISAATVKWWLGQPADARQAVVGGDQRHISEALIEFAQWLEEKCCPLDQIRIWGNGATFDPVILEQSYRRLELPTPWRHWNSRCFRTVRAMFPHIDMPRHGTHHNALDDAITQAKHMLRIQAFMNNTGEKKAS